MVWGFGISLLLGGILTWLIIDVLLVNIYKKKGEISRPDLLLVIFLGVIERFMYTTCIILNVNSWIAVWLAFKVITRWAVQTERAHAGQVIRGNIYLVGNALTVIFGVAGGLICKYGFNLSDWINSSTLK
jgi:hypothetical protein